MNISTKKIQVKVCPSCGAKPENIQIYNLHTNGDWNERVKYGCGYTLHYSPNFRTTDEIEVCNRTAEYQTFMKKRKDAKEKLVKYIGRMDVDESYKKRLVSNNQYV